MPSFCILHPPWMIFEWYMQSFCILHPPWILCFVLPKTFQIKKCILIAYVIKQILEEKKNIVYIYIHNC
jgi:hypothetical protein